MEVIVDLDETLSRSQRAIISRVNKTAGTNLKYHSFLLFDSAGVPHPASDVFRQVANQPETFKNVRPFNRAPEGLQLLHANGIKVHIASGRPETLHLTTEGWFEEFGLLPFIADIHHKPNGVNGVEFKADVAKKINAATAFDDAGDVAYFLSDQGILIYLIRRPWNDGVKKTSLIVPSRSFYQAASAFLAQL